MSHNVHLRRTRRATALAGVAFLLGIPAATASPGYDPPGTDLPVELATAVAFNVDPATHLYRSEEALTVVNTGSSDLVLRPTRIQTFVRHESTATFSVLHDCAGRLAPNASCTLSLSYSSAIPGRHQGELVLSDVQDRTAVVRLNGEG